MDLSEKFSSFGLISIKEIDPSILIDLKYATKDNFTGSNLYGDLRDAYFVPEIAMRLKSVQGSLRRDHPDLSLIIYDAARPMSIQRHMFEFVKGTDKEIYVAAPYEGGGYHNYGLAVDLSIIDSSGYPLDMGSHFDCFDIKSHVGDEDNLVRSGLISASAKENRAMLSRYMTKAGFDQNPSEWWHFQRYSREEMIKGFKLLDF